MQEADPFPGIDGAHGGHETAEQRDAQRIELMGAAGCVGGGGGRKKESMG